MKIRALFFDDWPRKAAALALALIIWYSVYRQIQETIVIRELPVQVSTDSKLAIIDVDQIPRITVTVRGPKRVLNTLSPNNIRIHYTIPEATPTGPYQVILRESDIELPGRAQITAIEPSDFTVTLDRLANDPRDVRAIFMGSQPEGWVVKNRTVTPPRVRVIGPSSITNDIKDINTIAITLDENIPEHFSTEVPLASYPGIRLEPEHVVVSVEFTRRDGRKAFKQIPIVVLNQAGSELTVAPNASNTELTAEPTVSGPHAVLDTLTDGSLRAFVDISGITQPGTHRVPVSVWINESSCKLVSVNPRSIELVLTRRPVTDEAPRGAPDDATAPDAPQPQPAPPAEAPAEPAPLPAPQP